MDTEALWTIRTMSKLRCEFTTLGKRRGRPWGTPEIDWFRAERDLASGESESTLSKVAREVGSVVGRVVAILSDVERS
jgi:hypothetical protein